MQTKSLILAESATRADTSTHPITVSMSEWRGAMIFVDVTASTGDGTQDLVVRIRTEDPASGNTVELLSDTIADGATGTTAYLVYPGASDTQSSFGAIEATTLGKVWDVQTEVVQGIASADFTYSIGVVLHK